jgi:hypothetical protein
MPLLPSTASRGATGHRVARSGQNSYSRLECWLSSGAVRSPSLSDLPLPRHPARNFAMPSVGAAPRAGLPFDSARAEASGRSGALGPECAEARTRAECRSRSSTRPRRSRGRRHSRCRTNPKAERFAQAFARPPAAACAAGGLTRSGADTDSHGRMDHPNKTLTENG